MSQGAPPPKFVRWLFLAGFSLVVVWLWIAPGVSAIATRRFEGSAEFRKGAPIVSLTGQDAVWLGVKFLAGGLAAIAVSIALNHMLYRDE